MEIRFKRRGTRKAHLRGLNGFETGDYQMWKLNHHARARARVLLSPSVTVIRALF